jgi:hypothetical protein
MAKPMKKADDRIAYIPTAAKNETPPTENLTHGMERAPQMEPLGEAIRAHTSRPHKGDVGRPETNDEVFQGSKTRELK